MPKSRRPASPPLKAGDVLPALQLATEHGHEHGWEAVRLSRPSARPFTGARLPRLRSMWHPSSWCRA
jgi:hypothetical protein